MLKLPSLALFLKKTLLFHFYIKKKKYFTVFVDVIFRSNCYCVFAVTCVVQKNDHVVPGQAVVRFEHCCIPPGIQRIHMSILVSIL